MFFGCGDFNARYFALVCLLLHKSVSGVELGPSRPSKRDVSKDGHAGTAGDASPSGREPHLDTWDRTEDVLGSLSNLDLEGAVRESQSNGPLSVLAKNIDIPGQDKRPTSDDRDEIQGIIGMESRESRDNIRKLQQVVNQAYHDYNSHEDISNTGTKGDNNFQGIGRHTNDSFDAIHDKTGDNVGIVQEVVIDGQRTDGPVDSDKTDITEGRTGDTNLPEFIPSLRSATAVGSSNNEGGLEGKSDEPKDDSDVILFPDKINPTEDEESDEDSLVETYKLTQAPKREKPPQCAPNERFYWGRCRPVLP